MSDEPAEDPILAIQREQKALRARLDMLDLAVEKLTSLDSPPIVTSITPENIDPPVPEEHAHTSALASAKRKSRQTNPPPPLPEKKSLPTAPPASPEPVAAPETPPTTTAADLEMKVGMVWLVRVGVVMLLSALVFGSKLAYTAFIADLPPIGKASLWYLFSSAFIVAGTVLERRDLLKNYARVLTAGGLAAVYYTTYAIHHVDRLRVIESPLLAGSLLLLCGLGILAFSLYKNSRNMAIAAVTLAYYAGAISPLGGFAMFSNLLLTALGVTFLIRRRWAAVSFVCLSATYATFLFWQFIYPDISSDLSALGFAPTFAYLSGYWVLFTAGAIISSPQGFHEQRRLAFSSINTGAYFLLATATILEFDGDRGSFEFWHFSLALGIVQTALALAPAIFKNLRDRVTPLISDVLLASGLSFLTIAAFAKLDGYQLALTLAVESALLLFVHLRKSSGFNHAPVLLVASVIASVLSAVVTIVHHGYHSTPIPLAAAIGSFFTVLCLAFAFRRTTPSSKLFSAPSTLYICAALGIGAAGVLPHFHPDFHAMALLVAAAALTFLSSTRQVALPELAPLSVFYSVPGALWFVSEQLESGIPLSAPITAGCLASGLAILLWWHFSPPRQLSASTKTPLDGITAIAFCMMLATAIHLRLDGFPSWQTAGGIVAMVTVASALALRAWPLAFVASLFHLLSTSSFFAAGNPDSTSTLTALLPTLFMSAGAALLYLAVSDRFFANYTLAALTDDGRADARGAGRYVANVSVALATVTFLTWAVRFFPDYATVVITLGGLAAFAVGLAFKLRAARLAALAVLAFALGRILIVDVWGFATVVRFVTFFVIGAVLVALGFVYNRFQETLRRYL